MVIHHRKCPRVADDKGENWLEVQWKPQSGQLFKTGIEVRSQNERGMLAKVTNSIAAANSSIEDLKLRQKGGSMTELLFLIEVEDRVHLANVLRAIRSVEGVVRVQRRNQVGLGAPTETRGFAETLKDFFSGRKQTSKVHEEDH
jgi:GTP pyrophosphokinase